MGAIFAIVRNYCHWKSMGKYFVNFGLRFLNHHMSEFYGVAKCYRSYSVQVYRLLLLTSIMKHKTPVVSYFHWLFYRTLANSVGLKSPRKSLMNYISSAILGTCITGAFSDYMHARACLSIPRCLLLAELANLTSKFKSGTFQCEINVRS